MTAAACSASLGETVPSGAPRWTSQRTSQRQAYVHAMARGLSVLDYEPGGKAAAEVRAVAAEVLGALGLTDS